MLPTVCQACGGKIERLREGWTGENPNICASCASAWMPAEPAVLERTLARGAGEPHDAPTDDHLLEVI